MREACNLAFDSITGLCLGILERAPVVDELIESWERFSPLNVIGFRALGHRAEKCRRAPESESFVV